MTLSEEIAAPWGFQSTRLVTLRMALLLLIICVVAVLVLYERKRIVLGQTKQPGCYWLNRNGRLFFCCPGTSPQELLLPKSKPFHERRMTLTDALNIYARPVSVPCATRRAAAEKLRSIGMTDKAETLFTLANGLQEG